MNSLHGKRILITGASSGIGKAIAHQAAALGASLILFGRNSQRLQATFDAIAGSGHEWHAIDVTDYAAVEEIINNSVLAAGPIHGFVHSAGVEKTTPFKASTPQTFKDIFEVNVFAAFELARILSQKKTVSPTGASFVFLSSVSARQGDPGKVAYCASKSALLGGVKAMALELSSKKIRCNCVLPGCVQTEMIDKLFDTISPEAREEIIKKHPLGLGQPDDVGHLVCFLLADQSRWITGSEYTVDGGYLA